MNACPITAKLDGEFARIFDGTPSPQRPRETERQADQRIADELRARNFRASYGRHPIHALSPDEE